VTRRLRRIWNRLLGSLFGRAIRGLLFEVQPSDPLTIAGATVVLLVVDFE
jgi:hypothetical protein